MNVLIPVADLGSFLTASSIAEPDVSAGEVAWAANTAYSVGDLRIRATTHRIYKCVQAVANTVTTPPESDPTHWLDWRPTNRYAAVDTLVSTQSQSTAGSLAMTFQPGFFNAVALYGLVGGSAQIVCKDAPGGDVLVDTGAVALIEDSSDWYEWLFSPIKQKPKLLVTGFPPSPTAELTITMTGNPAKCGMVVIGDLRPLSTLPGFGTRFGAKAEPVDFSYVKTEEDGTTSIVKRNSATDMRAEIIVDKADADAALFALQEVLSVPAGFIADITEGGFDGLNVFGLGQASVSYESAKHAAISLYVKGLV